MRRLIALICLVSLAACGGGGDSTFTGPQPDSAACSNDGQKAFVLDNLYAWYLWNDLLPDNISIADYASPEELAIRVTTELGPRDANGDPLDLYSSVGSAAADADFFGAGRYEGFGFSWRLVASDEARLSRVIADSPADIGGLERGQRILSLDGRSIAEINAAEGVSAALAADTIVFEMQRVDSSVFSAILTKDSVTIDPVPQYRIIDGSNGVKTGYLELAQFIGTAEPVLETVFSDFIAAGVDDVIVDMRYNGGGLVRTANLLGDHLGAFANDGRVFSETQFNADRAAANNTIEFFERLSNSIDLGRLVIIATRGTASASELVANSMESYFDVTIVGDRTFGKPVGQIGLEFCEKILRVTAFRTVNAAGEGDYFDGLPVDCAAPDDLDFAVGSDADPNMVAAMTYLNTGACPAQAAIGRFEPGIIERDRPQRERRESPEREFADAY